MKRSERHHLKENELALRVAAARRALESNRRALTWATLGTLLVTGAAVGYFVWNTRTNRIAQTQLGEALSILRPVTPPSTPDVGNQERKSLEQGIPKLLGTADAYPNRQPGIAARYHAAAALAALGRFPEAEKHYAAVISKDGTGLYGQSAKLGLAETQAATRRVDQAIATYRELAGRQDTQLPVDGVLMALGRLYVREGRPTEAVQTFSRIIDQFPDSPYASEARAARDAVKPPG